MPNYADLSKHSGNRSAHCQRAATNVHDGPPEIIEDCELHSLEHFRRGLLAAILASYRAGVDRELLEMEIEGTLNAVVAMRGLHRA